MGLSDFLSRIPACSELNGSLGEWLAKQYAAVVTNALVMHDILSDGAEGYTSQIDLLSIDANGVYVVEVKTFGDAKIYGDGNNPTWYYYNHGKKYEIYSPLRQNKKHVEYLKKFLQGFGDFPCFSIVVLLCSDFKVRNVNTSGEITTAVCNSLPAMKRALYRISENKPIVFDENKKQAIFQYIQNNQHEGKQARAEHKRNVIAYKEELAERKKQQLCPYCKTPLVLRQGRYGAFYGCVHYPKCKYTLKPKD